MPLHAAPGGGGKRESRIPKRCRAVGPSRRGSGGLIMGQPYTGEIRIFAGNFPPSGWAFCDGQLMPISEAEELFNLIGTMYGGDAQETFALPDLRGRVPIHFSDQHPQGETAGSDEVTLTVQQIPVHKHPVNTSKKPGSQFIPFDTNIIADLGPAGINQITAFKDSAANPVVLNPSVVGAKGGGEPHDNIQPTLAVNYIIALKGIFPTK